MKNGALVVLVVLTVSMLVVVVLMVGMDAVLTVITVVLMVAGTLKGELVGPSAALPGSAVGQIRPPEALLLLGPAGNGVATLGRDAKVGGVVVPRPITKADEVVVQPSCAKE